MSQPLSPPPPSEREPLPTLTAEVVADEESLAEAVDEVVRRDPVARDQLSEITTYQEALRGALDADTWKLVLRVEELTTARLADVVLVVARWAYEARGRRSLPNGDESRSAAPDPPTLDGRTVEDEYALEDALGVLADRDTDYRAASRDVLQLQERLRALVTETAWATYLKLEVATNSRDATFDRVVARWAFSEGVRSVDPRRGGA